MAALLCWGLKGTTPKFKRDHSILRVIERGRKGPVPSGHSEASEILSVERRWTRELAKAFDHGFPSHLRPRRSNRNKERGRQL